MIRLGDLLNALGNPKLLLIDSSSNHIYGNITSVTRYDDSQEYFKFRIGMSYIGMSYSSFPRAINIFISIANALAFLRSHKDLMDYEINQFSLVNEGSDFIESNTTGVCVPL